MAAETQEPRSLRVVQLHLRVQLPRERDHHFALTCGIMVTFVEHLGGKLRSALDAAHRHARSHEVMPDHRAGNQEHHHGSDDRQVELEVQPAHLSILFLGEHVTRTAQRENPSRPLRVILDGRAQARDVHVDRTVEIFE